MMIGLCYEGPQKGESLNKLKRKDDLDRSLSLSSEETLHIVGTDDIVVRTV